MVEGINNKLCNLTHKVIHSGLILLSISIDIRGREGHYSRLKCAPKLHFVLPRIGYLLNIIDSIQDYYCSLDREFLSLIENNGCWFEFNNFKINSEYPIGLLFDIYSNNNGRISFDIKLVIELWDIRDENNEIGPNERISIVNYNINKIITNNIKLSQSIIFGDCRRFQMMSKKDYENLLNCIHSLSRTTSKYEFVIRKLFGTPDEIFRDVINIPVKIYIRDKIFLRSFKKIKNSRLLNVEDILIDITSDIDEDYSNIHVFFHGILIPYNTPLIFLMAYCSYVDGIVHIVFKD